MDPEKQKELAVQRRQGWAALFSVSIPNKLE